MLEQTQRFSNYFGWGKAMGKLVWKSLFFFYNFYNLCNSRVFFLLVWSFHWEYWPGTHSTKVVWKSLLSFFTFFWIFVIPEYFCCFWYGPFIWCIGSAHTISQSLGWMVGYPIAGSTRQPANRRQTLRCSALRCAALRCAALRVHLVYWLGLPWALGLSWVVG